MMEPFYSTMGAPLLPFPVCTIPFLLSADIPISDFAPCFLGYCKLLPSCISWWELGHSLLGISNMLTLIWSNGFTSIHPSHDKYLMNINYVPGNGVGVGAWW